jgi:hypothetical protein
MEGLIEKRDIFVVGRGFSGLYPLDRPRELSFSVTIYDAVPVLRRRLILELLSRHTL